MQKLIWDINKSSIGVGKQEAGKRLEGETVLDPHPVDRSRVDQGLQGEKGEVVPVARGVGVGQEYS